MNILEKQEKFQNEARILLNEIGLIGFLSTIGEVKIVGSFALGLMTRTDVDIDVGVSEIKDSDYFNTITHLFKNQKVKKLILADNRFLSKDLVVRGIPKSLYLGVYVENNKTLWNIDIRFVLLGDLRADKYTEKIKSKLNDTIKEKILRIKAIICLNPHYLSKEVSSVDIYSAVLDKNVQDIEGFKIYLANKGIHID